MKSTANLPQINHERACRTIIGLTLFGILYDPLSHMLLTRASGEQKESIAVAVGTAVTIVGAIPIIGRSAAARIFLAFVASGTPMIVGQFRRHARNRERTRQRQERLRRM